MNPKILAITSSHRNGNTDFIVNTILNSEGENGAETGLIRLREKNIRFCNGRGCCSKTGKCGIKDDMLRIYQKLERADIIILASPSYFGNVSARMKNFIDRCNPYYHNKKLRGKRFFLIAVGKYDDSTKETVRCMENFLKGIYAKKLGSYCAIAEKTGEVKKNKVAIRELRELCKIQLFSGLN